ncbi:unnamed protein product [Leptosia nina]|uniref:Uncharacterized protein n=1 Tax=Leptosia nina TaxID=320188 RepID=A0AAV1JN19_9NEOP
MRGVTIAVRSFGRATNGDWRAAPSAVGSVRVGSAQLDRARRSFDTERNTDARFEHSTAFRAVALVRPDVYQKVLWEKK